MLACFIVRNAGSGSRIPRRRERHLYGEWGANIRFCQIFKKKLHEIENVLGHRGASSPLPRSTNDMYWSDSPVMAILAVNMAADPFSYVLSLSIDTIQTFFASSDQSACFVCSDPGDPGVADDGSALYRPGATLQIRAQLSVLRPWLLVRGESHY